MSTLVDYWRSVERSIRLWLPSGPNGVPTVKRHNGRFGPRDIEEYSMASPAVVVAMIGANSRPIGWQVSTDVHMAAFVLSKSKGGSDRADIAAAIVEALISRIPFESFHEDATQPTDVDCDNLYNAQIDEMSVALWGVQWKQKLVISRDYVATPFIHAHIDLPGEQPWSAQAVEMIENPGYAMPPGHEEA